MKFIHTADIHLGAQPDKGKPWSERRKEEIWESFRRLIAQAGQERVNLLLIAGDLFHSQPLKGELKEVNYLFSTIPEVQVVLMAGNHDYIKKNSHYRDFPWNSNVHFLMDEQPQTIYLEQLETYVTGMSYYSREITENLYDNVVPENSRGIHILLAHGGDEKHIPIQFSKLSDSGFDYIALGHIHKPQILKEHKMAYSGALEPIDRNEWGAHGYITGEITKERTKIAFVPFAKSCYLSLEIQTNENMPQSQLEEKIAQEIRSHGKDSYYSITLVGSREPDTQYQLGRLERLGNIVYAEDYTEPAMDIEKLRGEYDGTIIGEYIEQFPENPSSVELKALHYGVQALLQTRR